MNPEQMAGWITALQALLAAGEQVGHLVGGWIAQAHPEMTADERAKICDAIMADDGVRAAMAAAAVPPATPNA